MPVEGSQADFLDGVRLQQGCGVRTAGALSKSTAAGTSSVQRRDRGSVVLFALDQIGQICVCLPGWYTVLFEIGHCI